MKKKPTNSNKLARFSQCMAVATLCLALAMFIINFLCWLSPELGNSTFGFSFSSSLLMSVNINPLQLPLWQLIGGIIISSLPLIALTLAALHLFHLFRLYAQKNYFSNQAAQHLGRVGLFIFIWVILQFLTEPVLGFWLTFNAPEGIITLSFTSSDLISLFLGGCFWVIAHILREASLLYQENQSFI